MDDFFQQLAPDLPLIAVLLLVLALLVAWQFVRVARGTRLRPSGPYEEPEVGGEAAADLIDLTSSRPSSTLKRSFARVRRLLRTALPGLGADYRRPWVLALGQSRAGKTTLLSRTGLGLRYGQPGPTPDPKHAGINWWAFDGGLVLDVFGDDVLRYDGRTSDRTEWRGLLRLIRGSRPRRPIDAVLLTLPATELIDAGKPVAQRLAEASRRAAILHHKLSQAQATLGVSFPIYLLISRCDLLPGFATLPSALSPWRRQQMFGWSSPHTPRTTYTAAWIDRAFAGVVDELEGFQLEALARGRVVSEVEDFALLPDHFRQLLEPLRVYCSHLFRPRAGIEPLLFRGLYFCGAAEPAGKAGVPEAADVASGAVPDVVFVGDLLEQKIFPEAGLARPTEQARFRARWRRAGLAAVAVAALLWLGVGLRPAERSLAAVTKSLEPPLDDIAEIVEGVERPPSDSCQDLPPSQQKACEVLAAASRIDRLRLRSPGLPASWASPLHARLRGSLRAAFSEIVFPPIRVALIGWAEDLASTVPATLASPSKGVVSIGDLPEFRELDGFTRELEALERLIARYRRFSAPEAGRGLRARAESLIGVAGDHPGGRDLVDELNGLTSVVLKKELRPPTPEARRAWERLLRGLDVPDIAPGDRELDARLKTRARQYAEALFEAVFSKNPLDRELLKVSVGLARLAPPRPSAETELEDYRDLLRGLERLQRYLELPEVQWLAADRASLGPGFEEIRLRIHGSRFLGPDLALELRERAIAEFRRLQSALLVFGTPSTGSLLARQDNAFVLRPPVAEIADALKTMLGEPFMQPQRGDTPIADAPADYVLRWRDRPLEEALSLLRSYRAYKAPDGNLAKFLEENELKALPQPLRGSEPWVTRETVAANVLDLIAEAQALDPEPPDDTPEQLEQGIRLQIKNLQAVEQDLIDLMSELEDLDYRADSERLAQILRGQQIAVLDRLDRLLAALDAYRPKGGGFVWWDGSEPPAPEAFDAASADDLAAYLGDQRQAVTRLSGEYAQPLLSLFGRSRSRTLGRAAPQTDRWKKIAADLSDDANQVAGNPVSTLEGLISGDLAEIDLYHCFDRLRARAPSGAASDFFLARAYALEQSLFERCRQLADEEGYRRYLELSELFNVKLAGSFPFASPAAVESAAPQAIRELFEQDFARALYLVRNLPDPSPRFGDQRAEVQEFMERMEKVRVFFAVFLAPEAEVEVPVYDLDVRFRVMRGSEKGANQILRWQLLIEDQKIDLLGTRSDRPDRPDTPVEPAGRWVWSENPTPLRLTVGWASGSPFSPQAAWPVERVTIDGKTLTYTYRQPWSLLRLLKEHPTPSEDFDNLRDRRPETIKLKVVTVSDDQPTRRATATLFCRIVLLDPTDKEELKLPVFPAFAPDFDACASAATDCASAATS